MMYPESADYAELVTVVTEALEEALGAEGLCIRHSVCAVLASCSEAGSVLLFTAQPGVWQYLATNLVDGIRIRDQLSMKQHRLCIFSVGEGMHEIWRD